MRYLPVLLGLVLMTGSAWAEDNASVISASAAEASSDPLIKSQTAEKSPPLNIFGEPVEPIAEIKAPDEDVVKVSKTKFPSCDDEGLMAQVRQTITLYQETAPAGNVYDRRAQLLAVKNITTFAKQDVDEFIPSQNYKVADRIIMLKMNQHLTSSEMELCSSGNPVLKKNIYLLLYLNDGRIAVDIIDYKNPARGESPYLSFVYQYDNK